MFYHFRRHSVCVLLSLCLLAAGCGAVAPKVGEPDADAASGRHTSPLVEPFPLPSATPAPSQLLVLHTNDNWGETEPCG